MFEFFHEYIIHDSEKVYRKYARLPKGEKVHESIKGNKYQRTSIVAGQLGREILAPLQYSGTMNGDFLKFGLRSIYCLKSLKMQ